jgi:hypothetical protein
LQPVEGVDVRQFLQGMLDGSQRPRRQGVNGDPMVLKLKVNKQFTRGLPNSLARIGHQTRILINISRNYTRISCLFSRSVRTLPKMAPIISFDLCLTITFHRI